MKSPIGDLDQRIALEAPTATPDGIGGTLRGWARVAAVWASVRPVRGAEAMTEGRMNAATTVRFTIRDRAVDATMRIVWQGVAYNIRQDPVRTRAQYVEILAERGVAE